MWVFVMEGVKYGEPIEIKGPKTHLVFLKVSQGLELVEGYTARAYASVSVTRENGEHEVCVEADDAGACYPLHGELVIDYEHALALIKNPLLLWRLLKPLMEIEEDDWKAWEREIDACGRYGLPESPEYTWKQILKGRSLDEIDEWEEEE